jgi:energy-coupling factor transporter ATP-binding protein EcfA2
MAKPRRMQVRNFGPVREADVELGDLTVFVGPQAAGKSLFLQLLKLLVDRPSIVPELKRNNIIWGKEPAGFFRIYFGEGLGEVWSAQTEVVLDDQPKRRDVIANAKVKESPPRVFYIPAQRVMTLRDGLTHPFSDFRAGDPFVVRFFSESIHRLVQTEFVTRDQLFPAEGRMNARLREALAKSLFGSFQLQLDRREAQRRLVLQSAGTTLPYMNWSAGQREFSPLLLGLLWLMPSGNVSRKENIKIIVIEEPEMGLHPKAISAFLLVVLELLRREYRVCLSTHSPHVLDVVWALGIMQQHKARPSHVMKLFDIDSHPFVQKIAQAALKKSLKTYFFPTDGPACDISSLDPADENEEVRGWGGLTSFSARIGDVVADVVARGGRP